MYIEDYRRMYCIENKCRHYIEQYGKCDVAIHKVNKNMQCVLPNEIQILRNRIEIYNRELTKIGYENDKLNEDLCDTCVKLLNSCIVDELEVQLGNCKIGRYGDNMVECKYYEKRQIQKYVCYLSHTTTL